MTCARWRPRLARPFIAAAPVPRDQRRTLLDHGHLQGGCPEFIARDPLDLSQHDPSVAAPLQRRPDGEHAKVGRAARRAWLAQLANYALITVLTIMAAALLLQIVDSYATQTAALGAAIVTVDALNMVLVAVLVFLFMRQVMPVASGLAGGAAFNTFGTMSRAVNWSARVGADAMRFGKRTTAVLLNRNQG